MTAGQPVVGVGQGAQAGLTELDNAPRGDPESQLLTVDGKRTHILRVPENHVQRQIILGNSYGNVKIMPREVRSST